MPFSLQAGLSAMMAGQQQNADLDARRASNDSIRQQTAYTQMQMMQSQAAQQQALQATQAVKGIMSTLDTAKQDADVQNGDAPNTPLQSQNQARIDAYDAAEQKLYAQGTPQALETAKFISSKSEKLKADQQSLAKSNLDISQKQAEEQATKAGSFLVSKASPDEVGQWLSSTKGTQASMAYLTASPDQQLNILKGLQLQGVKAKDQLEMQQKAQDSMATQTETSLRNRENHEDRLAQISSTAANQAGMLQLSRDNARSLAAYRQSQAADTGGSLTDSAVDRYAKGMLKGDPVPTNLTKVDTAKILNRQSELQDTGTQKFTYAKGSNAQNYGQQMIGASSNALMETGNTSHMALGQTAGVFSDLDAGHGITSSLTRAFGNQITDKEAGMYNAGMTNMGMELGRLMSGGQRPNQTVITEMNRALRAEANDSVALTLYKRSNAMALAASSLEAMSPANEQQRQQKERNLALLRAFPTPTEVYEAAKASGHGKDISPKIAADLNAKFKHYGDVAATAIRESQGTGQSALATTPPDSPIVNGKLADPAAEAAYQAELIRRGHK